MYLAGYKATSKSFFLFSTLTHIKMEFVTITLGSDGCVDNTVVRKQFEHIL
jgi:hypothetical protein